MKIFAGLAAVLSSAAFFQPTFGQSQPAFEVADIHASAKVTNPYMRGGIVRGTRYEVKDASVVDLITSAWGVQRDRVQGGPTWLDSDRFDIIAKAPEGLPQATVNLMLQALLADRFKLVVHNDTKPLAAYALTVGKGKPKMKEAVADGPSGCQGEPQNPGEENPYNELACRHVTMEAFAEVIRGMAVPGGLLTNPVVDMTGLKGAWDFDFKFSTRRQLALNGGADAITLIDAVDKQLGLKLESQKIPLAVVVVDGVQKPTDNPPDVAAKLPPPPAAEFEVAEIRPSLPGAQENGNFQNGKLNVQAISLKELVKAAWDINSDDLIAGLPKFAESARFDVVAKSSTDPKLASQVDDETLLLMLRALLVDRFKLKTHMEERQVSAYTLSAAKPKLQKADPANRTECMEGPGADGKDPRVGNPALNRLMTCHNMTMAQFAEQMPNRVSGYVQTQVLDATGIEGAYDFTISFSAIGILRNLGQGRGGAPSEPSAALSFQDALSKQLGLKLELQKRTAQVLVVDHVEEKPTEN
jgi:uncharacterized protein (TIGR03435 family)